MIKNQHYVPKFYLKNFRFSKNQVAVFDKTTKKSFISALENIANENYFYDDEDIDKQTETKQFMEKLFHPLEDRIAQLLPKLIESLDNNTFSTLNSDLRLDLAFYIIYQFCRTKEFRVQINQMTKLITQTIADEFVKSQGGNPEDFEIETNDKVLHIDFLLNNDLIDTFIEDIFKHIWIVLENKSEVPFLTSDHPVVKRANIVHPVRSFSGLRSPGVEIAFPISPKYCLLLAERSYAKIFEPFDGKKMPSNKDNVLCYNSLQIIDSYRFVFSSQQDFKMAEEMIDENPGVADINRARIGVNKT